MVESRYTDQTIVKCHTCGWIGKVADCVHSYIGGCTPFEPPDDVVPIDYCPACDSIELENKEVPDDSNTA